MEENDSGILYSYDARRYLFDVRIPAVLSAVAIPTATLMIATRFLVPVALIFLIVSAYTLFNTLIARTYPATASLDDNALTFYSFGRTDAYPLDEIRRLQVRENRTTLNAYVRINGGGILRGRYFVGCGDMRDASGNNAERLYRFFLETEARLDPDNLRVRARAVETRKAAGLEDDAADKTRPESRRHHRKKK